MTKKAVTPQRIAFEKWFAANNMYTPQRTRKGYISETSRVAWRVWQHQEEKIAMLREALWAATEHNALWHGENHNTVTGGRAALFATQP